MFKIEIFTPEKKVFAGEVDHLVAKGKNGWFGILTAHAPLLASLLPGDLRLDMSDKTKQVFNLPGSSILEIDNNKVILLTDMIIPRPA